MRLVRHATLEPRRDLVEDSGERRAVDAEHPLKLLRRELAQLAHGLQAVAEASRARQHLAPRELPRVARGDDGDDYQQKCHRRRLGWESRFRALRQPSEFRTAAGLKK